MESITAVRYLLASGTQVRNEEFGLLFYTMKGPQLYFLSCGAALDAEFFHGEHTVEQWLRTENQAGVNSPNRIEMINRSLNRLKDKGVIIEC